MPYDMDGRVVIDNIYADLSKDFDQIYHGIILKLTDFSKHLLLLSSILVRYNR